MYRKAVVLCAIVVAAFCSSSVMAGPLSANFGWNSEYIFRGIPQKNSSAFGGLDLEAGGFYLGTWAADVGDGLEIDYYGGYGVEVGDLSLSAGGTIYTYTGDFDDTYKEFNFSAGYSFLTFDAAVGRYENFHGPTQEYQFYSLTAEYNGFWAKAGMFDDDFDGEYYELGYGNTLTVADTDLLDYSITLLYSNSTLLGGDSDTNLVFTLGKSFDL
jgi:uncharacterized protein (TIGR02001 family)